MGGLNPRRGDVLMMMMWQIEESGEGVVSTVVVEGEERIEVPVVH